MPKLFSSKKSRAEIAKILQPNDKLITRNLIVGELRSKVDEILHCSSDFFISNKNVLIPKFYPGRDSSNFDYTKVPPVDLIITSPPYMQAQEYIRTFRLEANWYKISSARIRNAIKKEIPYKKLLKKIIRTNMIDTYRAKIDKDELRNIFDSYFTHTLGALENASSRLKKNGKLCVLIGNPMLGDQIIEIWKVVLEYFTITKKYKLIDIVEDKIAVRKLFKGRKNRNPSGLDKEYLLILEKRY